MTFGTKKGHFNAHKIAPVSNSDLFFFFLSLFLSSITHDYTFTRRWAINSTLNIPGGVGGGVAVIQFAHGFAEGERPQLGSSLKWTSFIICLLSVVKRI